MLLALAALAALIARVSPYLRESGVLGWPVDYDEGVYLSASALLWQGVLPYRDFIFLHPPGIAALLSFATAWNPAPSTALVVARLGVAAVGALDVLLAALLVRRHAGIVAACVTSGLLIVWPEVIMVDRGVHLEPFLTAACLLAVGHLCSNRPRLVAAGVWLAIALLIKSWAVLWMAAFLVAAGRKAILPLVVAIAIAGSVFAAVAVLQAEFPTQAAPSLNFLEQVVWFHAVRPPDGDANIRTRLAEIFVSRSCLPALLVVSTSWALWRRRNDEFTRIAAGATVIVVLAFLGASAYWNQYNAHLAFPFAMLCGTGVGEAVRDRANRLGLGLVLLVLSGLPGLVWVIDHRRDRDDEQAARVTLLRSRPEDTVCAFEPHDLVLADRWPPKLVGVEASVDSYGQMLLDSVKDGARYNSASEALASEAAQRTIRKQLHACPVWLLGWRGRWQLNAASKAMVENTRLLDPQ